MPIDTMKERKNFDSAAASWDEEPRRVKLAGEIAAAMRNSLPFSSEWNAMDFGCGTGLLTLQLAPHLSRIVGVDSSQGMLDCLNAKLPLFGITNIRTMRRDHDNDEFPNVRFNLITSAMTLHHVPEIVPLLTSLRSLLHPGGWIALADLEQEDGSFHEEKVGVFHHGFDREQITVMLIASDFSDICITTATSVVKGSRSYPVFLATARAI